MASHAVGSNTDGVGDDAVRAATGRGRDEWFGLLDAAGAAGWKHRDIATWLVGEQRVDPWWSQNITVAYEQARGIRRPGQRQDGTFEASVTRTVALEKTEALRALVAVVTDELGTEPLALNLDAKHPTARFPLDDGEYVLASSSDRPGGKASIGLVWGRMPDDARLVDVKTRMRGWLASVG
ncbi:DUF4287 domain-containing protein [Agromyces sp. SYSU K20354]|uniref:DUF4287 domain-containing protein n=1 Tax=Agromyces cavernae TaxID=2898659 RepID=UPI001E400CE7|nr:DUF4287 domain-containing protein [Agromyces cavernae]MCD2442810.1 DUF4287 domain-containing protein [Agromyces cavernae]